MSIHWHHLRRVPTRTAIAVLVVAAHVLVLWMFWRARAPEDVEVETFTSILFFVPAPSQGARQPTKVSPDRPSRAAATTPQAQVVLQPPADPSTAITVPVPPAARVDWSAQLTGAAQATLENEKKTGEQLGALLRKFRIEDDPRNSHPAPSSSFRWYDAGIHRFDTRGALPVWHLNDHCVIVALIFAACALGHIEIHGDLFEGAAAVHDEKLATSRPNEAP
jgi:hypothetical protein